jgi:hypothetical protein
MESLRQHCDYLGISCFNAHGKLLGNKALLTKYHKHVSGLIDEIYNVFKLYPEVFPDVYFRFLKADLEEAVTKGTFVYQEGIVMTWKRYQRNGMIKDVVPYKAGDYLLEKMVSLDPGNGVASEYLSSFLMNVVKTGTCFVKVVADNKRAVNFYIKNGFKKIADVMFGSIPGIVMKWEDHGRAQRKKPISR